MRLVVASTLILALTACTSGSSDQPADFRTADSQGIGQSLNPGTGVAAAPGGDSLPANPLGPNFVGDDSRDAVAREIEEADLYRAAGNLLYLLNAHRGLVVVDLTSFTLLSRTPLSGFPVEMYLRGSRAFVLLNANVGATTGTSDGELVEVDVADPSAPQVERRSTLEGQFKTSRLVGDILYAVSDLAAQSFDIAAMPFATLATVPLAEGAAFAHATDGRLFVTSTTPNLDTRIRVIDTTAGDGSMVLGGTAEVSGQLDADTKIDFGGGVLRCVTHDIYNRSLSRLFTIDVSDVGMPFVRATLPLVRDEQLFGVRFTEDRAYIVTFQRVDPLWIVDLANPDNPRIVSELQVPGFATQLVADGDRLVTLGYDAGVGPGPVVSLFDVSDPTQPSMLSRIGLGATWSEALHERKAFTVLSDLVLVPVADGLAVVDRTPTALSLRDTLPVRGGGQRGFELGDALIGFGPEQVVVADRATLAVHGKVTIATNVIDVARLPDDRLVELVGSGAHAIVEDIELDMWPERFYAHGSSVGVVGWDEQGRAVYVIDFDATPPAVSPRLSVGWGGFAVPLMPFATPLGAPGVMTTGVDFLAASPAVQSDLVTEDGWLVLHGMPEDDAVTIGGGEWADGLCLVDLKTGRLGRGVRVLGGAVTGIATDGDSVVFTYARSDGRDPEGRPLLRHDALRLTPASGRLLTLGNVPGYVVAADGDRLTTIEELWGSDWSFSASAVAVQLGATPTVTSRLALAPGAYDFRVAGALMSYSTWSATVAQNTIWMSELDVRVVRLGDTLLEGPDIPTSGSSRWPLAMDPAGLLIQRDVFVVERWDVSGTMAILDYAVTVDGYPNAARPDSAGANGYLIALGYSGATVVP